MLSMTDDELTSYRAIKLYTSGWSSQEATKYFPFKTVALNSAVTCSNGGSFIGGECGEELDQEY